MSWTSRLLVYRHKHFRYVRIKRRGGKGEGRRGEEGEEEGEEAGEEDGEEVGQQE